MNLLLKFITLLRFNQIHYFVTIQLFITFTTILKFITKSKFENREPDSQIHYDSRRMPPIVFTIALEPGKSFLILKFITILAECCLLSSRLRYESPRLLPSTNIVPIGNVRKAIGPWCNRSFTLVGTYSTQVITVVQYRYDVIISFIVIFPQWPISFCKTKEFPIIFSGILLLVLFWRTKSFIC